MNNGQANFDLTRADQIIKNGISNLGLVSYFESLDTTTNTLSNPIANPSNFLIYQFKHWKPTSPSFVPATYPSTNPTPLMILMDNNKSFRFINQYKLVEISEITFMRSIFCNFRLK
jgi:hypothetical protein